MRNFVFIFSLIMATSLSAQKQQTIEPTLLECRYQLVQLSDTVNHNKSAEDEIVLRIGKTVSQSFNYNRFYGDSLMSTPQGNKLWGVMMMKSIKSRQYGAMPIAHTCVSEYVYKNYPQGKLTCTDQFKLTFYQYDETMMTQQWQTVDSTKQILGYNCQKAECDFRGRHYIAWFAIDIPLNNGPWKLSGLPGLILEAYDNKDHYHFTAVSIKQNSAEPICFYHFNNFIKTDRNTLFKEKRKFRNSDNKAEQLEGESGINLNVGMSSHAKPTFDTLEKF